MSNIEPIRFAYAMIKDWSNELKDKDYFECIINNNDLMAIETILKENQANKEKIKELEETNRKLYELRFNNEYYISKSKVRKKIEELESEIEQLRIEKNVTFDSEIYRLTIQKEALQLLLEKE